MYELNYKPAETRLLREARAAGCATLNGWPMLQAQARLQFDWWRALSERSESKGNKPVCA